MLFYILFSKWVERLICTKYSKPCSLQTKNILADMVVQLQVMYILQ